MDSFGYHARFFVFAALMFAIFSVLPWNKSVSAQSIIDFSIQITPEFPKPNENVSARIVSYSVDLDKSTITWVLNGKTTLSGTGKKSFSFKLGAAGASSRLAVNLQSSVGTVNKNLEINPPSVDLLWEATDSYTPPFYRGKALPSTLSVLRVVAMPEVYSSGKAVNPNSLVYKWTQNGNTSPKESGYGKNYADFQNGYLDQSESISVTAEDPSGGGGARNEISIDIREPLVLLYEQSPLRGVKYERALQGNFNLTNEEVVVTAEPYFFSAKDRRDAGIIYSWFLNGRQVSGNPDDESSIVLRRESGSGSSLISLSVKHPGKLLQEAANAITVNFGER